MCFGTQALCPRRAAGASQPFAEPGRHVFEGGKGRVPQAAPFAEICESAFGDDEVRPFCHAEVGSTVADDHTSAGLLYAMGAFAIASLRPAIGLAMWEGKAP